MDNNSESVEPMSAELKVEYEQCAYELAHVESVYRNLAGLIINDGLWHDFPKLPTSIGVYRVFKNTIFQAMYAQDKNILFERVLALEPLFPTKDDAEWTIHLRDKWYYLSSRFTLIPQLVRDDETLDWLERHALYFRPCILGLQGEAAFESLELGCIYDAKKRLDWLEDKVIDLNVGLMSYVKKYWRSLKADTDDWLLTTQYQSPNPEELVPLPDLPGPREGKKRVSL